MSEDTGCPPGMYPMDPSYPPNEAPSFEALRGHVESEFNWNSHNWPVSWWLDGDYFELVLLMPRKNQTCSFRCPTAGREAEIQGWLDSWVREQVMWHFGWDQNAA